MSSSRSSARAASSSYGGIRSLRRAGGRATGCKGASAPSRAWWSVTARAGSAMGGRLGAPSDGSAAHWSAGPDGTTPARDPWKNRRRRLDLPRPSRIRRVPWKIRKPKPDFPPIARVRLAQWPPPPPAGWAERGRGSDRSLECCSVSQDPVLRQTGTPTRDLPRTSGSARRFVASQPATPRFGANRGAGPAAQPRAEPPFRHTSGPGARAGYRTGSGRAPWRWRRMPSR